MLHNSGRIGVIKIDKYTEFPYALCYIINISLIYLLNAIDFTGYVIWINT